MTLFQRNFFLKSGIVFSCLCFIFIIVASFQILPFFSEMEENINRPSGFPSIFFHFFIGSSYYAVYFSIFSSVLFSITGIIFIYLTFKQTIIQEIFYIAIFTTPVFAEPPPNYGEKLGTWLTEQIFWIALVVVAVVLCGLLLRRAWVPVLVTGILSAIVLYVIRDPSILTSVGESLFGILN